MEKETSEMEMQATMPALEETETPAQSTLESFDGITTNTDWLGEDIRDPHDKFRGGREDF